MKNKQKIKQSGYECTLVKQLFMGWRERKKRVCHKQIEKILEIVKDMHGSLDIMAREMARKAKKHK